MDSANPVTHVSLCAGYGGIDLGLKRAIPDLLTIAVSEIEAFAAANMVAKMEAGLMDPAPIWTDLKTFPWGAFRDRVGILSGGYPCQPFSSAGKRLGKDDPRHLWPWIADGIRAMRPQRCFFENVEGHISLGLREVIEELESIGYRATWGIFSAAEVGATHQRKRVFILADRFQSRLEGHAGDGHNGYESRWLTSEAGGSTGAGSVWPSRPGQPQYGWEPPRVVVNANGNGLRGDVAGNASQPDCHGPDDGISGEASSMGDTRELLGHGGTNHSRIGPCGESLSESGDAGWAGAMGHAPSGARFWPPSGPAGHAAQSDEGMDDAKRPEWRQEAGHPNVPNGNEGGWDQGSGWASEPGFREAQPPLGRDLDGPANRLDHAELYVTCDNRTDELRLLGNGVVPAVAERAYRILSARLTYRNSATPTT